MQLIDTINQSIYLTFPVLFVLVAIFTRKDLAVLTAITSILGAMVIASGLDYLTEFAWFITINSALCIFAASYNKIHKCNLSILIASLAFVQAIINVVQITNFNVILGTVTGIIELTIMAGLITMDGRKGLLNGLADDFNSFYKRNFSGHSGNHNNKGHL